MDILFKNADVITMDDAQPVIRNGYVGVSGKLINYVGDKAPEEPAARVIDCKDCILMPGLINTHAHTAMCAMRGYADDYKLQEWLFEHVFPAEARLDGRAILAGARFGFAEMIRTGTVSMNDMYFNQPAVAELALETGIRASLSNAAIAFGEFEPEKDRAVQETIRLAREFHMAGDGRIRADASVHAEFTSRPEVWEYIADIAREYKLNMHVHLSETRSEHEECMKRYSKTPAQMFSEHHVFDTPTIAAHCVHVTDEDMKILASHGVSVAHNPVSNLKLASGIARVNDMIDAGVNVTLGTDGCCSNNTHDMFEDIKIAALLAKVSAGDPSRFTAYDALKLVTVNGARAQSREGVTGAIKSGYEADIILIDTDCPTMRPYYDPISAVVYSATGERVCYTMVQGKVLYDHGEFTTIDYDKALCEIESYAVPTVKGTKVQ